MAQKMLVRPHSFADVATKVTPAIVSIATTVTLETNAAEMFGPFMFQEPRKIQREALGSGIILTRNGLVVTNNHCVERSDKIKVITSDEVTYDAELVIRDPLHDLAIIKIITDENDSYYDDDDDTLGDDDDEYDDDTAYKAKKNKKSSSSASSTTVTTNNGYGFPTVEFGKSELCKVGDLVLAIGNNLGFHGTVTDGIISAIGRTNEEKLPMANKLFPLIQTNAAINQGSSGGGLVNMKGQLIGVNESIATQSGGNVGVGFAVPSNFIIPLLRSAMKRVFDIERVWDGITPIPLPIIPFAAAETDLVTKSSPGVLANRLYPRGIRIKAVHSKSPAHTAGLRRGDIVIRIDGVDIDDINTYYLWIVGCDPKRRVTYDILRPKKPYSARTEARRRADKKSSRGVPSPAKFDKDLLNRDETHKSLKIECSIGLIPPPESKPLEIKDRINPFFGATVVELCPAINAEFALDFAQQGIAIWDVEPGSQVHRLGFRVGDIIVSIDTQRVRKLKEIEEMADRLQLRKNCRIRYKRHGVIQHVDVYLRTRKRYTHSRL